MSEKQLALVAMSTADRTSMRILVRSIGSPLHVHWVTWPFAGLAPPARRPHLGSRADLRQPPYRKVRMTDSPRAVRYLSVAKAVLLAGLHAPSAGAVSKSWTPWLQNAPGGTGALDGANCEGGVVLRQHLPRLGNGRRPAMWRLLGSDWSSWRRPSPAARG